MSEEKDSVKTRTNMEKVAPLVSEETEKTVTKNFSFCAHSSGSNVSRVDVKNGRIVRIRPLHYDEKYQPEEFKPWQLEVRGKVFQPTMKEPVSPFGFSYKKRVYSPNRIKYPLKRVDWDPMARETRRTGVSASSREFHGTRLQT